MKNQKMIMGIAWGFVAVIMLILVIILFNSKTVVCKNKSNQEKIGYVIETKYVINALGKNVKTVEITEVIKSKDKNIRADFEKQLKDLYSYNKNTYGGYSYKITNKGDEVYSKVTINYKRLDMKKFIKNNEAMKKFTKDNHLTLEGAKKLYESTGAICK